MTTLFNTGSTQTPDQIEFSLKNTLSNSKIPFDNKDSSKYVTFTNITFQRAKNTEDALAFKDAKIHKRSILTKIFADIQKVEGGRKKIVAKKVLIGHVPQLLERKTFMVNGTEMNLVNQLRRNSSSYVTKNDAGETYADFNLAKGRNFKIDMDYGTSKLSIVIGTSNIAVRTLGDVLGVTREEFKEALGEDLTKINWDAQDEGKIEHNYYKLYKKLYEYRRENINKYTYSEIKDMVKQYYKTTTVDPRTTGYLYGASSDKVDKKLYLNTLKKFKRVNDGQDAPVDTDDLYYQKLYTSNLLFSDRIERTLPELAQKVKFKIRKDKDYDKTFKNFFSKPLISTVNTTNLSRLDPQFNPLGIQASSSIVTPMGMGGIGSLHAVRSNTRGVHASNMGVIDPIASPQGMSVGVQQQLVDGVKVDEEGNIFIEVKTKAGTKTYKDLLDLFDKNIAIPGEADKTKDIRVLHRGEFKTVKTKSQVDFYFSRDTDSLLHGLNKLIPFSQATQGNRNYMTFRFFTKALPLVHREVGLVETITDEGKLVSKEVRDGMENFIPSKAPATGIVQTIRDSKITIKDEAGETHTMQYHKHLPFATNTGLHQRPLVRPGNKVKKGQRIISDPFTDNQGRLALGVNLKTAFMPYHGLNSEDAVVISEGASTKLTSIHYYKFQVAKEEGSVNDLEQFKQLYGDKYTISQTNKLDSDGVIRQGEEIGYGDIVIAVLEKRVPDDKLEMLSKLSKNLVVDIVDGSKVFKKHVKGTVIEVQKTNKVIAVTIKTLEPAQIGDKISGAYGNKGVIASVLPDKEIIQDAGGKPVDAIWASSVVVSRMNPGQIIENTLGKIVKETGRSSYKVPVMKNPKGKALNSWAKEELKKNKVKDKERVYDPTTGKYIERPIAVGYMNTMKLLKADKDVVGRGIGPSFNALNQPSKGGKTGGKAVGLMEAYALMSHGAEANLSEMATIKGEFSPDFWKNFEMGNELPLTTNTSFAWDSMKAMLTTAGGHIEKKGDSLLMVPLTDKITKDLAQHRTVKTPQLLSAKNLTPLKQGLYDPAVTGGVEGKLWSKIDLEDGIVSPLVSERVRLATGKSTEQFSDWQAEKTTKQLKQDLDAININKEIKSLEDRARSGEKLSNNEIKVVRFLKTLKGQGTKLSDLIITKLPVPPPVYRPVIQLADGGVQMHDLNHFYKDVMLANSSVKDLKGTALKAEAKKTLIQNVGALAGTEPTKNVQLARKGAKGVLSHIGGVSSPKTGYVHASLLKKPQEMSGRARLIPDASLDMDTVGLPADLAWKTYAPHTRKQLLQAGVSPSVVDDKIESRDEMSTRVLKNQMEKIPVWLNRAPSLHRGSILGMNAVLAKGDNITLNMHATKPLNADFDGDAAVIHVPVTRKAIEEIHKFKLSATPFSDTNPGALRTEMPVETNLGIYQMSLMHPEQLKKELKHVLGSHVKIKIPLDAKELNKLMATFARENPSKVRQGFKSVKLLGEKYSTQIGSTVGIDDIETPVKERNHLIRKFKAQLKGVTDKDKRAAILSEFQQANMDLAGAQKGDLALMVQGKAKGKSNQLAGILTTPAIAYDPDRPIETAKMTEGNFSEGLSVQEMWDQNAKARKDLVTTYLSVTVPGEMNKLLLATMGKEVISEEDCGTLDGKTMNTDNSDILGRVVAKGTDKVKRGTIITAAVQALLPKFGTVVVRSPETCETEGGLCAKCYGLQPDGSLPPIGTRIGIRSAHGLSEPLSQMAMDAKHGGRGLSRDTGGGLSSMTKLFSSKKTDPSMARISKGYGTVKAIDITPSGVTKIKTDGAGAYNVPRGKDILVKVGDTIEPGQQLSEGVVPFTEITKIRGIKAGRRAFSEASNAIMTDSGRSLQGKIYEVQAKTAIAYLQVDSPFEGYSIGDIIPYNKFKKVAAELGRSSAVGLLQPGQLMAEEVLNLSVASPLLQGDIDKLKADGITRVKVLPSEVRLSPLEKSLHTSGLADDDWVSHLGVKYIKRGIIEAVAEGQEAPDSTASDMSKWIRGKKLI